MKSWKKVKAQNLPVKIIERIRILKENVKEKKVEEAKVEAETMLSELKASLYGTPDRKVDSDEQINATVTEIKQTDFVKVLMDGINLLPLEAQKHFKDIFNFIVQRKGAKVPTYIKLNNRIIDMLWIGATQPELSILYGDMLKTCFHHKSLCVAALQSPNFYDIFDAILSSEFALSSNSFQVLKTLLTSHPKVIAPILAENYETFFERYNQIMSGSVIRKRQSTQLLSQLFALAEHKELRSKYISNVKNFQLVVGLLNDESAKVAWNTFHLFKYFVVNPNVPSQIREVLSNNAPTFLSFLESFEKDKTDDAVFVEDKDVCIARIKEMSAGNNTETQAAPENNDNNNNNNTNNNNNNTADAAEPAQESTPSQEDLSKILGGAALAVSGDDKADDP